MQPIPDVQVIATASPTQTLTLETDLNGYYSMTLKADTYSITAGPKPPGYPVPTTVNNVVIVAGNTTTQDLQLSPVPHLVENGLTVDDDVVGGNNNGYPERGETGLHLYEGLFNDGAIVSTSIIAHLSSLTPGVTISTSDAAYPDISPGQTLSNTTPFVFSLDSSMLCGTDLDFQKTITDKVNVYSENFTINASVPLPRTDVFNNNVEAGTAGWTTGGLENTWGITTGAYHSATHSWTDSPGGDYVNNTNSYLRTPALNLTSKRTTQLSLWVKYALEAGYDFVYLDYSLDGGSTWSYNENALLTFNGHQDTWKQFTIETPILDGQANVALRFRLVSDPGVTANGIFIDDIVLSYEPYSCYYGINPVLYMPFVTYSD